MADVGKAKTPVSAAKKGHDGSIKKRRKHKKPSGDGAQSLTPSPVQLNQNQVSESQQQTKSQGAAANIKGGNDTKESASFGKDAARQDYKEINVGELASSGPDREGKTCETPKRGTSHHSDRERTACEAPEKKTPNPSDRERRACEAPEKKTPNPSDKDRHTCEVSEKSTSHHSDKERNTCESSEKNTPHHRNIDGTDNKPRKQEEAKVGEPTLQHSAIKQENRDGEPAKKSSQKQAGKDKEHSESHSARLHGQASKEDGVEKVGKGERQKVDSVSEKSANNQMEKAKGEKVPESAEVIALEKLLVNIKSEVVKKHTLKVKAEPEKRADVGGGEQKSKAQLRAERRAVQEAQRAAKDTKKIETVGGASGGAANSSSAAAVKRELVTDKPKPATDKPKPAGDMAGVEKNFRKKPAVEMMNGEKNFKKKSAESVIISAETEEQLWTKKENEILGISLKIDNSILNLGFQYFHHNIVGANARCMALLATLKEVITKYKTPNEKELSRDLEKNFLNPCISYINYCRPISTSMGNAIKHLKHHINHIPCDMDDETAIDTLRNKIDKFIEENITKAAEAVAQYATPKIDNGDVILVYAASSLIGQVLKTAFTAGKKFRVIVVEGRPRSEGKSMLRYLVRCGIPCSYVYIGSASHAMSEVTKVFLGAAAMFAIGDMYSRSGNSMIAALAKANNIPVLVCCETYKFTDKVQLHTGDSNMHTRGKDLVSIGHKTPILANWEEIGLNLLNLMYDVTGSEYITAVVTELGMLPCTSVPVVLRRQEDVF